jgi:hypothetical protein
MENKAEAKILQLLDVISVEVAATRSETSELRNEMRAGFGRVDRRFGNLENRIESLETEVQIVKTDLKSVKIELRSFRGEFERRIAPLER